METITPNLSQVMGENDSESIRNAILLAKRRGVNSITIPRLNQRTGKPLWSIGSAIVVPSEMEIVLDNCHLRQEDGCYDNMFRTFLDPSLEGHTVAERRHSIVIRGRGNAVLDGGIHNGLTQKNSRQDGMPCISRNSLILFYNVRGFVLENFEMRNARYWGITLFHAERGRLSGIHLNGQCDCRNQDGIDLRVGCSDILLERITGQTGDDVVALSAIGDNSIPNSMNLTYGVEGHHEDIHDVVIKDVIATSVECSVIGIRNCDGRRIYNVTIDNIHCTDQFAKEDGKNYPVYPKFMLFKPEKTCLHRLYEGNNPYALLRIGQHGYYGIRNSRLGELYHIHATNLHMYKGSVVVANVSLENCYFGNIYAENDVDHILTTKDIRPANPKGAAMRGVVFENVFYRNEDNESAVAFDLDGCEETEDYRVEGLLIHRAFLGNCKIPFQMKMKGEISYDGLFGTHVEKSSGTVKNR